eukprot:3345221-Rhodomonas_salina.1
MLTAASRPMLIATGAALRTRNTSNPSIYCSHILIFPPIPGPETPVTLVCIVLIFSPLSYTRTRNTNASVELRSSFAKSQ